MIVSMNMRRSKQYTRKNAFRNILDRKEIKAFVEEWSNGRSSGGEEKWWKKSIRLIPSEALILIAIQTSSKFH